MNKKHVCLYIDTSRAKIARVTLQIDGVSYSKESSYDLKRSQALLPVIESLLAEHSVPIRGIRAVEVMTGPGSFTGLRVGFAVANMLACLLELPVNGKQDLVTPTYV